MFDIITFGSATRDVFLLSCSFRGIADKTCMTGKVIRLELGTKIEVEKIIFETGGGGTNSAVTFARQGLRTAFAGKVGRDIRGEAILAQMKQEQVDTRFVVKDPNDPTG